METPDWLSKRRGAVRRGINEETWVVVIDGRPQYKLFATPAKGQYTCAVTQTVNGRRLDEGKSYATLTEAIQGGLEELRTRLGWG